MSLACVRAQPGHSQRRVPRSRSDTQASASAVSSCLSRCRPQRRHVTAMSSTTRRRYAIPAPTCDAGR